MLSGPVKADASGVKNQWHYERHRPEQSLLYQTVERVYPDFLEQLAGQGKSIPSQDGCSDIDSAVWIGPESKHSLSYAFPRRCLCRGPSATGVSAY